MYCQSGLECVYSEAGSSLENLKTTYNWLKMGRKWAECDLKIIR